MGRRGTNFIAFTSVTPGDAFGNWDLDKSLLREQLRLDTPCCEKANCVTSLLAASSVEGHPWEIPRQFIVLQFQWEEILLAQVAVSGTVVCATGIRPIPLQQCAGKEARNSASCSCRDLFLLWVRQAVSAAAILMGAVSAASLCCVGFGLGFQSLSAPPHLARQEKSAESSSPRCARQEYARALASRQRVVWQARQCNDASER